MMPSNIYKQYENLIVDFLWGGKRVKIPLRILQGNRQQGGLGLIDIKLKDQVSKLSWIFQLEKSEKLANLAYEVLKNLIGSNIWQVQIAAGNFDYFNDGFWLDVLKTWNKFKNWLNKQVPVDRQIIWFNSNI